MKFIFPLLFCVLMIACKSSKVVPIDEIVELRPEDFGAKGNGKKNDTEAFLRMLSKRTHLTVILGSGKTYIIEEIVIDKKEQIKIVGNGSVLKLARGSTANSLLTVVDPGELDISNLTFEGNYHEGRLLKDLLSVFTPNFATKTVKLDSLVFRNSTAGGVRIHNIYPDYKSPNFRSGAEEVLITNCIATNTGTEPCFYIRGSHKSVKLINCIGEDPLSRQKRHGGAIFGISAEVGFDFESVLLFSSQVFPRLQSMLQRL